MRSPPTLPPPQNLERAPGNDSSSLCPTSYLMMMQLEIVDNKQTNLQKTGGGGGAKWPLPLDLAISSEMTIKLAKNIL